MPPGYKEGRAVAEPPGPIRCLSSRAASPPTARVRDAGTWQRPSGGLPGKGELDPMPDLSIAKPCQLLNIDKGALEALVARLGVQSSDAHAVAVAECYRACGEESVARGCGAPARRGVLRTGACQSPREHGGWGPRAGEQLRMAASVLSRQRERAAGRRRFRDPRASPSRSASSAGRPSSA